MHVSLKTRGASNEARPLRVPVDEAYLELPHGLDRPRIPPRPPVCAPVSRRARPLPGYGATNELEPRLRPPELSAEVARAADVLDAPIPEDALALDESLRVLAASRSSLDLDLARLLRIFRSLGLARHLGFDGFRHYVEERLGVSTARAAFLARLDYMLYGRCELTRAVRNGTLGTVAALLVARVARSDDADRCWIERARRRTVVRLREEVAWAEREARWPGARDVAPPPPGPLPSTLDEVVRDLDSPPLEVPSVGGGRFECETSAVGGSVRPGAESAGGETFAVAEGRGYTNAGLAGGETFAVELHLVSSAVGLWSEARRRLAVVKADPAWVTDEEVLREAALAFLRTHFPLWLEEVRHGDPIAVRDRFRCQIPGCSSRCGAAHHIRFRSQGGPDEPWNLVFVCPAHHLQGIHRGHLRVSGRAPGGLVYELGIRADGTALDVFLGQTRLLHATDETNRGPVA